jgi:predicted PhzF superfamily epimerase YddE/YHI9
MESQKRPLRLPEGQRYQVFGSGAFAGNPEDSATGSAHCYLAAWWLAEGQRVQALQWSPQGPATMQVRLERDEVWISGNVVAVHAVH